MDEKAKEAVNLYNSGFNCAQSVLAVYAEKYRLNTDPALKLAGAFGGGMGMGATCGAVTGALMVIGLKYGQLKAGDKETKEFCKERARDFIERFRADCGALSCNDLLGCDMSTEKGREEFGRMNLRTKICSGLLSSAVQILDDFGY